MSKKYKGRIPGSFIWLLQDTVKSEAWKAANVAKLPGFFESHTAGRLH